LSNSFDESSRFFYFISGVFNYEKPPLGNPFFDDSFDGMSCPCLPECNRVDYAIEVSTNIVSNDDNMTIDFHYQSSNIVKYRTDVTFGWLDLMVSFGGIAGLFLGCSILSGIEIVYYFIIMIFTLMKNLKTHTDRFLEQAKIRDSRDTRQAPPPPTDGVQFIKIQSLHDIDNGTKVKQTSRY